jgi:hypothetical protein
MGPRVIILYLCEVVLASILACFFLAVLAAAF